MEEHFRKREAELLRLNAQLDIRREELNRQVPVRPVASPRAAPIDQNSAEIRFLKNQLRELEAELKEAKTETLKMQEANKRLEQKVSLLERQRLEADRTRSTGTDELNATKAMILEQAREMEKLIAAKKKIDSEIRIKDFRFGKSAEEVVELKKRLKEITENSRNAAEISELRSKAATDEYVRKEVFKLFEEMLEYCRNMEEYAQSVFKIKELDICESSLSAVVRDSYPYLSLNINLYCAVIYGEKRRKSSQKNKNTSPFNDWANTVGTCIFCGFWT